jgi:hypothetical protein
MGYSHESTTGRQFAARRQDRRTALSEVRQPIRKDGRVRIYAHELQFMEFRTSREQAQAITAQSDAATVDACDKLGAAEKYAHNGSLKSVPFGDFS